MPDDLARPLLFARTDARPFAGRGFGILPQDLTRHAYILGRTGTGKTTLLERLFIEQVRAGHGVGLIDPHGDLATRVLEFVPRRRANDVLLFDPTDTERPVGFNVLACDSVAERPLVAAGVLASFRKTFKEFWGPRLEHVLRNALLALLSVRGATLLGVLRMLTDARFRASVVRSCDDVLVRYFWETEFARYPQAFLAEVLAPVQNKVAAALTSPTLRTILGQHRATLDPREVMDEGRIFVANLALGRLGEDASRFLGALLVASFQRAAYARAAMPIERRRPFVLYVDEFQSFVTPSFGELLAEARKYGVGLVLAHQHLGQLDESLRRAVLGNVGSSMIFRVGGEDAQTLSTEFSPELSAEDLTRLDRHQLAVRLAVRGQTTRPFTAVAMPPLADEERTGITEILRRISRERYGRPRAEVEAQILRQLGLEAASARPPPPPPSSPRSRTDNDNWTLPLFG